MAVFTLILTGRFTSMVLNPFIANFESCLGPPPESAPPPVRWQPPTGKGAGRQQELRTLLGYAGPAAGHVPPPAPALAVHTFRSLCMMVGCRYDNAAVTEMAMWRT